MFPCTIKIAAQIRVAAVIEKIPEELPNPFNDYDHPPHNGEVGDQV